MEEVEESDVEEYETESSLTGILGKILLINVIGIFLILMSLLMFGVFQDYFFVQVYNVAEIMKNSGMMDQWVLDTIVTINSTYLNIPFWVDSLFMMMFIIMAGSLIVSSYYVQREGIISILGLLTYGVLVFLFFGGLFVQITDYIRVEILNVLLPNVVYTLTMFNWYMDNIFMVNTVICLICIVANFIDLETISHRIRKDGENVEEI